MCERRHLYAQPVCVRVRKGTCFFVAEFTYFVNFVKSILGLCAYVQVRACVRACVHVYVLHALLAGV